ncbi:MAG: type VI secretion system contractile sheath small subunit, partial [Alphaproteobacteria bacterium]|nr:type VI secretion system contractile sheath small subunit [Alphaproteobacteria bacterium]
MFLVDTNASAQNLIAKNNPPRVQISYEVYTKGATLAVSLPFVAGIMADLAGTTPRAVDYKDRDFTQLDNDSFDQFMGRIAPSVNVAWTNAAGDPAGDTLAFATM